MRLPKIPLAFALVLAFAGLTQAQAPVQTTPAKIGVINSERFASATGGITKLVNALRALDAEFRPRRDEIAQLVARFNSLQQATPNTPAAQLASRREQVETLQIEIQRKQEDARVAYGKRLSALTNPIRLSVFNALETWARQRGIDVLIDLGKFPDGVLLVNQNADVTPAFIRDFNSKNP